MARNWHSNWEGFVPGRWSSTSVNVRDFIQKNYTPYEGDDSFLVGPTKATTKHWEQVMDLSKQEREAGGVLDMDTKVVSGITSHGPGYLNKDLETIVGFQTDKPFKRSLPSAMKEFFDTLKKRGINVTLRQEQGHDIDAACGQLRRKNLKKQEES